MSYMFYGCQKLEELDLSNINLDNISNVTNMFWKCYGLATAPPESFKGNTKILFIIANMKDLGIEG